MVKLFEQVGVSSEWVTKSFEQVDFFTERMQIFSNSLQTVVNGIPFTNGKSLENVFLCLVTNKQKLKKYKIQDGSQKGRFSVPITMLLFNRKLMLWKLVNGLCTNCIPKHNNYMPSDMLLRLLFSLSGVFG